MHEKCCTSQPLVGMALLPTIFVATLRVQIPGAGLKTIHFYLAECSTNVLILGCEIHDMVYVV